MAVVIPPRKGVKTVWPMFGVTNPGKGLDNVISSEYIDDAEASDLLNVQFLESGCPAKRPGILAVGTGLSSNPKGLASYYTAAGNRYLVTVDGTALKYLNGSTWTTITGVTFTAGQNTTFVQAQDNLYIWNGTDPGAKLNASLTLTHCGEDTYGAGQFTAPSAAFGIYYNGRQMVAGVSSQPSRLYISAASDMAAFTVTTGGTPPQPDNSTDVPGATKFIGTPGLSDANFIDISKSDGQRITGLVKYLQQLIVFKERSTWSVTFDTTGNPTVQQVSAAIGCVGHRSIDNVDNDVYFLSRNGYYTLGAQPNYLGALPRTSELSLRVHPIIETITPSNLPNTASLSSGYVFYSSISTGGTTTNNTALTYDTRYEAWSKWVNVNANSFTEFIDSSNVKHLYYAADDQAQVFEILSSSSSDNGTPISSYWTSKAYNLGDFSLYKQVLYIDFEFRQVVGTVTINVFTDGNTLTKSSSIGTSSDPTGTFGNEVWGTPLWGGSSPTTSTVIVSGASSNTPYRVQVNKKTRTIQVQIQNNNNNETYEFLGLKIYYRPYAMSNFPSAQKLA